MSVPCIFNPQVLTSDSTAGALPGRNPGGEAEIAARVKFEGRSARLDLGNDKSFFEPSYPGTPRDLSEKERPQYASHSPSFSASRSYARSDHCNAYEEAAACPAVHAHITYAHARNLLQQ